MQKELDEKVDKKRAEDSGGDSTCASGAHPRTNCGAGCKYPIATDLGGNAVFFHVRVRIVRWNRSWTSPFSRFRRKLPSWRHSACIPLGTDSACSCHPFPSLKVGFTARTQGACSQRLCGESPRAKVQCVIRRLQNTISWTGSEAECRNTVCVGVLRNCTVML